MILSQKNKKCYKSKNLELKNHSKINIIKEQDEDY